MKDTLTAKQRRFVTEYLKDQNGKQAGIRCGFSPKNAEVSASRLLSQVNVRAAVDEAMQDAAKMAGVDAAYVLAGLKEVAERCMQRTPVMIRQGREMVQKTQEVDLPGGGTEEVGVWEFDSMGANTALKSLGQHLKLFTDKTEVTGKDGGPLQVNVVKFA